MRASLDGGDRLADLERFGNGDATRWAEMVPPQTEKGGGNKIGNGNRSVNFKVEVTRAKNRQQRGMSALLDGGDRLVHLESLCDRDATLTAELGFSQAAKGGGDAVTQT